AIPVRTDGYTVSDPDKFSNWVVVGPNGGDVRVVTIDPRNKDHLFISTLDGQIYASIDAGKTWTLLVNLNQPGLVLDQLQVDLRDSNIIYASGHRFKFAGGFFKSKDGGLTWRESKELRGESIHSMAQSSKDPDTILVGTLGGVWISTDSGDSWTKMASSPVGSNNVVDSMAIDPRNAGTVYAGTWYRAFKTTDSGKSWRQITDGMIDDSDIFAVNIDPRNADHVIASACSGIYESVNAGEKWKKIQGIPSQSRRTRDIVQNPGLPDAIYAATTEGFWMSTNGGKSWILTTQRDLEINSIAVHPDAPNRIFIGTNNYGVMVSNDGGRNFVPTNDNFTSRLTYSITPDIERANRVYVITQNTVAGGGYFFYSDSDGTAWQQAKGLDINRVRPYSMLQDRATPDNLYLGTNAGIYRSLDRGVSWSLVTAPKPAVKRRAPAKRTVRTTAKTTARSAAARRTTAAKTSVPALPTPKLIPALTEKVKVLTFTDDGKNGLIAGTGTGVYRTYDLTKGWEKLQLGEGINDSISVIYTTPVQPDTIWVGTEKSGVVVSHDNGSTWAKTDASPDGIPVSSIAVDPKRPDYVYVGTVQAFYLSRNGGQTWNRRGGNLPLGNFTSILINPTNTDEIYVSSALETDGGIYYSENAGMKWKRVDSKDMKLPSRRVWSMAFDPQDPNRIFAGSHSSGVYRIDRLVDTGKADTSPQVRSNAN
ncbi:MAG: WD40/YVTN/BNR-like repeat-containing protein, partial [Pyrinomonadaceae bacterium]